MQLTYRPFLGIVLILTILGTLNGQNNNQTRRSAQNNLNSITNIEKKPDLSYNSSGLLKQKIGNTDAIFSEDFDGIPGPTSGGPGTYLFPSGWVLVNVDGRTPNASVAYVNDAWERREDFNFNVTDSAAFSTSWYAPVGQADDWMISPPINIDANSVLKWNAVAYDPDYLDGYEVRISTTTQDVAGCLANPALFTIAGENSTWTERTIDLAAAGYTNQTVYIAWRNNSNDKFLLLVDDILVESVLQHDAQVTAVLQPSEYTMIPGWQNYPVTLGGSVRNNGLSDITNVMLTASIYQNNILIHTEAGTPVAAITPGSTVPISLNSYTVSDTGNLEIVYSVSITEVDQDTSNNSAVTGTYYFTENEFARDDNNATGSLGIGAGNGGELGLSYVMQSSGYIRGVKLYFTRCYPNQPVFVTVRNFDNGIPTNQIAVTDTFFAPDENARWITLNISGGEAALPADTIVITANEIDSTLALGNTNSIFTPGTGWVIWPTSPFGGWANVEEFGSSFAKPFMLRPLVFDTSLPVELLSFTAFVNKSTVSLEWNTASEINNMGFSVQRKINSEWTEIAFINGNGTSTEMNFYSYNDDLSSFTNSDKIYYRLKQLDFDGTYSFSKEVMVQKNVIDYKLSQNYPNPFNPVTRINFQLKFDSYVTLKVYDVLGNEVAVLINANKPAGVYNFDFNASSLASGTYFYKLSANEFHEIKKMILIK
jgi:hypothetical protein